LKQQGVNKFLINIHHHGQSIIDYLNDNDNFGVNITISDERAQLLDTGGAILKAHNFIRGKEPVLVHNVDIVSEIDIQKLLEYHNESNSMATLCVRKRKSGRGLLFNNTMQLTGWTNIEKHEFKWVNDNHDDYNMCAFSGVYMIAPEFADLITQTGKFSIIDTWLEIAKTNKISGYIDMSPTWHDLGTIEKINIAKSEGEMNKFVNS